MPLSVLSMPSQQIHRRLLVNLTVVSAAGVANLVRGTWLKQGAVVIDVGTNPIEVKTVVFYCTFSQ